MKTPFGEFEPPYNGQSQLDMAVFRALQWCEHIQQDFFESGWPINIKIQQDEPLFVCEINGHTIELLLFEAARSMYGCEHTRFPPQTIPMKLDGVDWPWMTFVANGSAYTLDAVASLLLSLKCDAYSVLPRAFLYALEIDESTEDVW
jgi:hypothetical protein